MHAVFFFVTIIMIAFIVLPVLVVVLSAGPGYKDYRNNDRSL
jgi:hypothetical protein